MRSSELHQVHEGNFHNVAFRNLVADQARYEWPNGFSRLLLLEMVLSDGRTVPLTRYDRHYNANPAEGQSGDSYLPTWRPLGGGFVLEPTPIDSRTNGLRLEYNGIPVELSADADVLHADFPELFDELLVLDTVCHIMHAEELQEAGLQRTLMGLREEWQMKWELLINNKLTSEKRVIPFVAHYRDY